MGGCHFPTWDHNVKWQKPQTSLYDQELRRRGAGEEDFSSSDASSGSPTTTGVDHLAGKRKSSLHRLDKPARITIVPDLSNQI